MSAPTRRNTPGSDTTTGLVLVAALMGVGLLVAVGAWVGLKVADLVDHTAAAATLSPLGALAGASRGSVAWPAAATWGAAAFGLAVLLVVIAVTAVWGRRGRSRTRVDVASRYMAKGAALRPLTKSYVAATARRLGAPVDPPGLPIAAALPARVELWQSWEDVALDIWGPRSGKTTARAVPMILAAPGAVMATSNKRDIVDATRDPRALRSGEPPWVFDPQALVDERPTWFWNPLSYVTDEVKAASLAGIFADSTRQVGARTDAYFDGAARDLLTGLLLAAARDGRPISTVYRWLNDPNDDVAARILATHGDELVAAGLRDVMRAPDKQRAGVYGSAKQMVGFLTNRQALQWAEPAAGRREFRPTSFVRSSGTLYSLSKEGHGSAAPLVTAMTVAVTEAAEEYAKTLAGGRLATPFVVVLDEAANVCRWSGLPNMYSHYGSRGICVDTLLQSWSQGVEVWGREGMNKLWSAATVRVLGRGVAEADFLAQVSRLIGEYERQTTSTSSSRYGGGSTSHQTTKDQVLDVSDLAALPTSRVIVLASGVPPILAATRPWMEGPHAEAVRASIAAHEPKGALL